MTVATRRPVTGWKMPGDGQVGWVASGEGGGDLDRQRGDQGGPGEPDHHGQGVDEGLGRDALAVEGAADLGGARHVVRERPADEVPQRPGDPAHEGGEQHQGAEPLGDANEPAHGAPPCSAVAVPVPLTVRWSMPATERIWVGWLMVTVTVTCSPLTVTVPVCPDCVR